MTSSAAVIVGARRTPITSAGHQLRSHDIEHLTAPVLARLHQDLIHLGLSDVEINDVIIGVARDRGGNPARRAILAAGLDQSIPGATVDRQCGSGLDAIAIAAGHVSFGASCVIAGGAESASTGPTGRSAFAPEGFPDPDMGVAAQYLADQRGIERPRQDAYARQSHNRAMSAADNGVFDDEIAAIDGIVRDSRPRELKPEVMARMPGAFAEGGSISAANACGVSDGAAAVVMVSDSIAQQHQLSGLLIRGIARVGINPAEPALGPVSAITRLLTESSLTLDSIDRIEITEAFAGQMCAIFDDLALSDSDPRVCADGGALALGHPWGASGAVLMVRLFSALVTHDQGRLGLAACAIAGGQGIAVLVERVQP